MFPFNPMPSYTGYAVMTIAEINVGETALAFPVYVLREINFPAKPVVHGQFRSDSPSVLSVVEHAMLSLGCVGTGAHVATEVGDVAKHERGPVKTTALLRSMLPDG